MDGNTVKSGYNGIKIGKMWNKLGKMFVNSDENELKSGTSK